MRIAFMHRRLRGGGTEADLCRMASGLAARGHDVHAFVATADAAPDGVTVRRVPIVRAGRVARVLSFGLLAPRAVARERFDVVVGCGRTVRQDVVRVGGGTHRSYLARMEADGLRRDARGPYHRVILWLERRMFSADGCRRVIAVSRQVAGEVERDYGVAAAHVRVLYNGVDLERFHPRRRASDGPRVRGELGVGDRPLVLAVGTGFARKGFDLLLRLWRETAPPEASLVLVGDDERLARYRREAAAVPLAGRVVVTGPRNDVPALMAAADAVCVPSRQEAFGNVVLEALAAGAPVVTTRRVGAAELLDGELGLLVTDDPEDVVALGSGLARALGPEHERFAAAGRRRAETLPWSRHLDGLEAILAEVAHGA
jgi:UDP-glucose:(heptosyl)LPS alpha-1,3-glucosyltransferase